MMFMRRLCGIFALLLLGEAAQAEDSLFAKPSKMIPVGRGSQLSMYCVGHGTPTIILESGFGGGTATTWMRLQPLLGTLTRTCSYDRAGYGFSKLGSNLPRDLNQAVADLKVLLKRSGEKPPYILVGHSNGGLMIGAFADLHVKNVAGLVFLDAAVALPEDLSLPPASPTLEDSSRTALDRIRRCLARAERHLAPEFGDECVNPQWYSTLPEDLAAAEISNRSKVDYWRAYLSEAENNYYSKLGAQARALLPHKWTHLPVRVFIASVSEMGDESAARSFGLNIDDKAALAEGRAGRALGERRQERICAGVGDCRVKRVPTANHLVHDEVPAQVVDTVRQLINTPGANVAAVYLGGAGTDDCDGITFDREGFAYLACHSSSDGFTGNEKKDMDAFILKVDPRKSQIVHATRIGGSDWDGAFHVVVDSDGVAWVSGSTRSVDFPVAANRIYFGRGRTNAFVARVDSAGNVNYTAMIGDATGEGLVVASGGKVYLAGTKAPDGEMSSAYVAEIPVNGRARMLTLAPGSSSGIAADGRGALFVTGFTGNGAFISRIDLSKWKQTGFVSIGNASGDRGRAIAVDRAGRPYVFGTRVSQAFPPKQIAGKSDAFLAGYDSKLKKPRFATLFGGSAEDFAGFNGDSLRLDSRGNLWIAGLTRSTDLLAQGKFAGADDGFIASFCPNGSTLRFATYFGGTGFEMLEGLAIAPDGTVWATGLTSSRGLAIPDYHGGKSDAILVKVTVNRMR